MVAIYMVYTIYGNMVISNLASSWRKNFPKFQPSQIYKFKVIYSSNV